MIYELRVIYGYVHIMGIEILISKDYHESHEFWSIHLHSAFAHDDIDAVVEHEYLPTALYILSSE